MTSPAPTPESQLTEVTRTVTPAQNGNTVSLAQTFTADPEELWSALTIGSHLEVWFGRASGEAVEGGTFELPDMETRGTVLTADAPHRLLLTWEIGTSSSEMELLVTPAEDAESGTATEPKTESALASETEPEPDPETESESESESESEPESVAYESSEAASTAGPRTRFELRHTVPADAHWATFGPAAVGCGWDGALYALALHLQDPSADLMGDLGAFAGSPEGAEFTRATADAWFEAHVAAGSDKKPARKASVRAAAFYLGEEPDLS